MPSERQPLFDPRRSAKSVVTTLTYTYAAGHSVSEHFHEEDQLVYAVRGVMRVHAKADVWVVPPQRAVWIPARLSHAIEMFGEVTMKTLYLRPKLARALPRRACVLHVSPLLRELVLHVCERGGLDRRNAKDVHLLHTLLDQIGGATTVPLRLPQPRDSRAKRLAELLLAENGQKATLSALCTRAGASKRTLERVFLAETQMSIGRYRQQARLLAATERLAAGMSVSRVAIECGYASASAFVSMFRRALGTTPGAYFAEDGSRATRLR